MTKGELKKSWPSPVYSGLLQNSHPQKMGEAIWEFLWCIDKTTLEEEGTGWVLGKKPVKIDEISESLRKSRSTVQRHLETLKRHHYITITRARRGIVIGVLKSKKWPKKAGLSSPEREILNFLKGISDYPFDFELDLEFLRTLWVDFPGIKILEQLKQWKVWLLDNKKKLRGKKVNYRSRFRNWLKNAQERSYGQSRPPGKTGAGEGWKESEKYRRVYE